jgi:4-hydroxy-tetrahydrodipicolinate synthase
MVFSLKDGVWPTMLTLFSEDNQIDYTAMERLIEWYRSNGVAGLFAVCQSSEMFYLSLEERVELARFVKQKAGSEMQVIASGHISNSIEDQILEIKQIADTGIDAFVLLSNRLAAADEFEEIVKKNVKIILNEIPSVNFGIYECPYPYKRLLSLDLLKWLAETGRFFFLKDTSCDLHSIKKRLHAVSGTNLKIFNANSATLLESCTLGVSGFSGVMANFHPNIYTWLINNWQDCPEAALKVQAFLGMAAMYELQQYPVNAKYYLQLEGVNDSLSCRSKNQLEFKDLQKIEVEQLRIMTHKFSEIIKSEALII